MAWMTDEAQDRLISQHFKDRRDLEGLVFPVLFYFESATPIRNANAFL